MQEEFSALDLLSVDSLRDAGGGSDAVRPRVQRRKASPKLKMLLPALAAKMARHRPATGLQGWPVRLSWADRGGVPALPTKLYDGPLFDGPLFDGPLFDEPALSQDEPAASQAAGLDGETGASR